MTLSAVIFPIGQDLYAVAADTVREVVAQPRATRLPTVPAALLGVFNLRGDVVPMFDTAALLGVGTHGNAPFAVVIATAAGPAGLAVDGLPRVAVLDEPIAVSELRGGLGTYSVDGAIAVLIDVEAVLLPHTNLGAATLTDGLVNR